MPEDNQNANSADADQRLSHTDLTPEVVEQLFRIAVRAVRSGNTQGGRALLRALAREQPEEPRIWLWLAGVAQTGVEQRQALERVLALDPENRLAQQGLVRLKAHGGRAGVPSFLPSAGQPQARPTGETAGEAAPLLPEILASVAHDLSPVIPAPAQAPQTDVPPILTPQQTSHWANRWLYLVVGGGALLIVLWLLIAGIGRDGIVQTEAQPTPPLPRQILLSPTSIGAQVEQAPAELLPATIVAEEVPEVAGVSIAPDRPTPLPVTITPIPTAPAILPIGSLLEYDGWQATLLRPDHARVVNGALGELQPRGRFVFALMVVGNNAEIPRRIPPDLFRLIDAQGRAYQPNVDASAAYLRIYARGQRGDLAIDDDVPPGSGLYSIPMLFDVSPDATGLRLTLGQRPDGGWPIPDGAGSDGTALPPDSGP